MSQESAKPNETIIKNRSTTLPSLVARYPRLLLFIAVFLAVFTLYTLTLAPGVVGGDAGEHQLAVPLLGIPHTTGYPLYVLVGKLWTLLLPIGSVAWRMNLFSALGGALAAAITTLITYHLTFYVLRFTHHSPLTTCHSWPGALIAGLALAFGLTLWQWSTISGVRSFNIFFFALMTWLAVIWQQQRRQGQDQAAARTLGWLAVTVGLSLAHHRTTVFYLPSLAGWIWWYDPRLLRQPKRLIQLALLGLAPLTLYAFIYWRGVTGPPYTHERITDFESFWFLVGSGDSSGLFLSIDPTFLPARLAFIWRDILVQFSWPGILLALIGGLRLARRALAHFIFQTILVLLLLLFTLDFEVVNLNEAPTWYLMPAYFILAIWLGLGLNGILDLRFTRSSSNQPSSNASVHSSLLILHSSLFTLATLALLIYTLALPNWRTQYAASVAPLDDWRQHLRGTQAQRLVTSSLPYLKPNSIIWGDWEQYTPFKYYQLIEGVRPDLTVRNPLDRWPEKVTAAREAGRPVYFTRKPADLLGTPYLSMAGPLIYLGEEPSVEIPADITLLQARFEDQLELIGYRAGLISQAATPGGRQAGPILQLMFYWRVPQKVEWDYALSLRLLDSSGQEVHRQDATHPVLSSYPSSLWTPGEVVGDFYELPFPPEYETLALHLLPYRTEGPGQWHNLTLNSTVPLQEGILLGPFERQ